MTKITGDVPGRNETYVLDYTKRAKRDGYEIQGLPDGYLGRIFFDRDRKNVGLHLGTNIYEADGLNNNQMETILSMARHVASDLGAKNLEVDKEALGMYPATELTLFNRVKIHDMTVPMTFDELASLGKAHGSITIKQDRNTAVPIIIPDIDTPVFVEGIDRNIGKRGILTRFGKTGKSDNRDWSNVHLDQRHYIINVDEEFHNGFGFPVRNFHEGFRFPVMNEEGGKLFIAINFKSDSYASYPNSNLTSMESLNEEFIRNMPDNTRIITPEIAWLAEFTEVSNRIYDQDRSLMNTSERAKKEKKDITTYIDSIKNQVLWNPDFNPVHELKKIGNLIGEGHAHKLKINYNFPEDYEATLTQSELEAKGFGHLVEKYPNLHFIRATLDSPEQMKAFEATYKKLHEASVRMNHDKGNTMEPGL